MKTRRTIIFAIIGLVLADGCLAILASGGFKSWTRITASHEYASAVLSAEDGEQFCEECWIQTPCNYSLPEFSIIAFPPRNIMDCAHETAFYGLIRTTYVRDKYGNYWEWINFSFQYLLGLYALLGFSLVDLFFGILMAKEKKEPWPFKHQNL